MDPRTDIREFLVSRRARITPEQAGLPAYGSNRRVKGLRREEVAMLAGISAEYYVRLERGNMGGVSEDVLDGTPSPTTASASFAPWPDEIRTTSGSRTSSANCQPAARSFVSVGPRITSSCTAPA